MAESVFFLFSFRNTAHSLKITRQESRYTQADMERVSGAVLGPGMSQRHSARSCSTGAIHCAESRHTGRFCLSISLCLSVSGHLHTPVCRNIGGVERGGDMWEHTRDLTACHSFDKDERWLMSDRWTGENDQEMCSISMLILSSTLAFGSYIVRHDGNVRLDDGIF